MIQALLATAILAGAPLSSEKPLDPVATRAWIKRSGAPTVASALFEKRALWRQVLRGVESGTADWLKVYRLLHDHSGCSECEEDLDSSLYNYTLVKAPFAVIPLLRQRGVTASTEHLCDFQFEAEYPPQGIKGSTEVCESPGVPESATRPIASGFLTKLGAGRYG